jgi:hypothetical protein
MCTFFKISSFFLTRPDWAKALLIGESSYESSVKSSKFWTSGTRAVAYPVGP